MHSYQPESKIFEPEYDKWAVLLGTESNLALSLLGKKLSSEFLKQFRIEFLQACQTYTERHFGSKVDLEYERAICMFGHQPVIYHSGLLAKHKAQLAFTNSQSLNSVELVIDTDVADPVSILLPKSLDNHSVIKVSLAEESGCYLFQKAKKIEPADFAINEIAESFIKQTREFFQEWNEYDQHSILTATVALRRKFLNDSKTTVLPISELMKLTKMKEVLNILFSDLPSLVSIYNATLENYRSDHKIRNEANPFPNMTASAELLELPFWYINIAKQTRQALYYNRNTEQLISEAQVVGEASTIVLDNYGVNFILAPRGMLTTFLLRVFCSDFFIHGLGGAKYDHATNNFISEVSKQKPRTFVAVSETRYLYPELAKEYLSDLEILNKEREILNHPEKYLYLVRNNTAKLELNTLVDQAQEVRTRLISAKQAKQESAPIQKELSEVNLQVRTLMEREVFSVLKNKLKTIEKQADLVFCREFPYFFWER